MPFGSQFSPSTVGYEGWIQVIVFAQYNEHFEEKYLRGTQEESEVRAI